MNLGMFKTKKGQATIDLILAIGIGITVAWILTSAVLKVIKERGDAIEAFWMGM